MHIFKWNLEMFTAEYTVTNFLYGFYQLIFFFLNTGTVYLVMLSKAKMILNET